MGGGVLEDVGVEVVQPVGEKGEIAVGVAGLGEEAREKRRKLRW